MNLRERMLARRGSVVVADAVGQRDVMYLYRLVRGMGKIVGDGFVAVTFDFDARKAFSLLDRAIQQNLSIPFDEVYPTPSVCRSNQRDALMITQQYSCTDDDCTISLCVSQYGETTTVTLSVSDR